MKKLYKLFVGEAIQEGMPANSRLLAVVPRETLKRKIISLVNQLSDGQDLYLVDGEDVSAYYRDGLDKIFS